MEAVSLHIYWSIRLDYPYNPIQPLIFIAELRMLFLTSFFTHLFYHCRISELYSTILVLHYSDIIMNTNVFQITHLTIVYSNVYSGADHRKHQSSASLAFVWRIPRWPVNSPHKGPVTRKMFPFDDVNMLKKQGLPVLICHILYQTANCFNFMRTIIIIKYRPNVFCFEKALI